VVGLEWTIEVLVISSFFRFSLFFGRWKRIPFISLFSVTFFFRSTLLFITISIPLMHVL
jgi:hypothetical protein